MIHCGLDVPEALCAIKTKIRPSAEIYEDRLQAIMPCLARRPIRHDVSLLATKQRHVFDKACSFALAASKQGVETPNDFTLPKAVTAGIEADSLSLWGMPFQDLVRHQLTRYLSRHP